MENKELFIDEEISMEEMKKYRTMPIKIWQLYLGLAIIVIQLFLYGFFFIQDRNDVINEPLKTEMILKYLKRN